MKTDTNEDTKWGWKVAAALVLVGPLALGVWLVAANPAERSEDEAGFSSFRKRAADDAGQAPQKSREPFDAGRSRGRRVRKSSDGPRVDRDPRPDYFNGRPIVRPDAATHRADRDDTDTGPSGAADTKPQWKDPVRQRVLGQKTWMAKVPDAERQALDEEIDRERPQPYQIDLDLRRAAIEATRGVVYGCFDSLLERAPTASGRLSVAFDLVADGGRARPHSVGIPALVGLHDPVFRACILDEVARISLPTDETGVLTVEYPLLFDNPPGQDALAPQ